MSEEIKRRIMVGKHTYFANITFLKSKLLSRAIKMKLYKTLIRPVICYGAETWILSKTDSNRLKIFERKVARQIYGAVYEDGRWRIWCNNEIVQFLENEICEIVKYIKCRIKWLGHVERVPKLVMLARMKGTRRQGHSRSRWLDEVKKDLTDDYTELKKCC